MKPSESKKGGGNGFSRNSPMGSFRPGRGRIKLILKVLTYGLLGLKRRREKIDSQETHPWGTLGQEGGTKNGVLRRHAHEILRTKRAGEMDSRRTHP